MGSFVFPWQSGFKTDGGTAPTGYGTPMLMDEEEALENFMTSFKSDLNNDLANKTNQIKYQLKNQSPNLLFGQSLPSIDGSSVTHEVYQTSTNVQYNPNTSTYILDNGRIKDPQKFQTLLPEVAVNTFKQSDINGIALIATEDGYSFVHSRGLNNFATTNDTVVFNHNNVTGENNVTEVITNSDKLDPSISKGEVITTVVVKDENGEKRLDFLPNDNTDEVGYYVPTKDIETMPDEPEPEIIETSKPSSRLLDSVVTTFGSKNSIDDELKDFIKQEYNGPNNKGDCRVSLNVAPLNTLNNVTFNTYKVNDLTLSDDYQKRLEYILGSSSGLLYNYFSKTAGLVFPYTPQISMSHSVEYDTTNITHSNLSIQHFKNSQPPQLSLTADFTADTKENAEYMVAAIWFLRACSKADFGENAKNPGLPPPVLYLNGWGALVNNIPVVITSFNINLPKDKHYVEVNMGGTSQWIPTQLSITIGLKIQPNIEKYKNQFDLAKYKEGILGGMVSGFSDNISYGDFNMNLNSIKNSYKIQAPFVTITTDRTELNDGQGNISELTSTKVDWEKTSKTVKGSGAGWTW